MSLPHGFDAWLTTDPHMDCDEGDPNACAYCGSELPDDVTGFTPEDESAVNDGFCCHDHLGLFDKEGVSDNYGTYHIAMWLKNKGQAKIADLYQTAYQFRSDAYAMSVAQTIADMFDNAPDGDFKWSDSEGGDPHVYACGEKDCDRQWHTETYFTDIGRENGKRYVHMTDSDGQGSFWDESDGMTQADFEDMGREMSNTLTDYFYGWATYWLDCAETGLDPCDQSMPSAPKPNTAAWAEFCIKAAEDNIKYLNPHRGKAK